MRPSDEKEVTPHAVKILKTLVKVTDIRTGNIGKGKKKAKRGGGGGEGNWNDLHQRGIFFAFTL